MFLTSIVLSPPFKFYFLPAICILFIFVSLFSLSAMNDNIVSTVLHATASNNVVGVGRGGIENW